MSLSAERVAELHALASGTAYPSDWASPSEQIEKLREGVLELLAERESMWVVGENPDCCDWYIVAAIWKDASTDILPLYWEDGWNWQGWGDPVHAGAVLAWLKPPFPERLLANATTGQEAPSNSK